MKNKINKFEELVASFQKLPGVGKKSALKFAYHVSLVDSFSGLNLAHNIEDAISSIKRCSKCGALSENEICDICIDENRDKDILCIVENPKDILILEESGSYEGLYFVFDDISEEFIQKLQDFILYNKTKEVIFAFTPSINSDGVILYIEDKLKHLDVNLTKIAQGVPTGVSLDNIDIISLNNAIKYRIKV
ncbi:recombination protein [Campylobacter blaseri]|uniref:Recombination protein RecR n=1 Tax=Campylobacter blaseri TaxID=2042961 RepID=A0A2P8R0E8_9BACT|nr:recombination mediator RecR [Campylobacter blaseri]PSM51973.1 recombination protein RecR [Campylobacter blaseri]PSM53758.1 recombination protein RecR [Campylobacter blaseri]QKF85688.1 recombination protein [Campylobacter blaseri]